MILFIFTEFICKQRFLTLRSFSDGVVIELLCLPVLVVPRISAVQNSFPEYVKTYQENTFETILTNSPALFTYPFLVLSDMLQYYAFTKAQFAFQLPSSKPLVRQSATRDCSLSQVSAVFADWAQHLESHPVIYGYQSMLFM